jgi:hypothetical protein
MKMHLTKAVAVIFALLLLAGQSRGQPRETYKVTVKNRLGYRVWVTSILPRVGGPPLVWHTGWLKDDEDVSDPQHFAGDRLFILWERRGGRWRRLGSKWIDVNRNMTINLRP